ncbi:Hpt domain-containing protein [Rhodobacteraceae bacterium NNCM2]|nr:Hpt domain-containing protein [Coraliihabitans acroporae]
MTEMAGLLDNEYLNSLESHLGAETMAEILSGGMTELLGMLERAREMAAAAQRLPLSRVAHDIAGCAGQLGLHSLSISAKNLERSTISDRETDCTLLVAPVIELGPKSIDALRTRLADKG